MNTDKTKNQIKRLLKEVNHFYLGVCHTETSSEVCDLAIASVSPIEDEELTEVSIKQWLPLLKDAMVNNGCPESYNLVRLQYNYR